MSEQKQNPSSNLKVTASNGKKKFSELEEMQNDLSEMMTAGLLQDPMADKMLEKVRPAFKPVLKMLSGKLGDDKVRYMLWRDPDTDSIVLETMNMDNIEIGYKVDPTAEDLIIVPPSIDNIDDLLKELMKKFGPKFY